MQLGYATHVGHRKPKNEDTGSITQVDANGVEPVGVLAVADGMSRPDGGEIASDAAVTAYMRHATDALPVMDAPEVVKEGIRRANQAAHEKQREPGNDGIGTTFVTAVLTGKTAVIGNVGDSRAYHIDDDITQLTADHASTGMFGGLTRVLGPEPTVEPDLFHEDITGTLLLCSDGVTDELDDTTIRMHVKDTETATSAADALVKAALEAGGRDNITAAIARPHEQ
ncbi:PP2C family protein-serine/threonine phosphatase [Salinibaculum rarum]|uniref:PP2C family protein-serine/threonine phosphatase n=1 Tax=Salinibaculum rarum TaxID=3058903 RepID=UPI00265E1589|nr:protein phosphatase 2C domain-containing protein [Salinibaculum sp. KK48]